MPLRAHLIYGVVAAADIAVAAFIARRMTEGEGILGPLAVLLTFATWALFVWLTPLGPHLWRASALGLVVLGVFLALSFAALRGVPVFVDQPDDPMSPRERRTFLIRCAWLILLLFLMPVIAHLAAA